MSLKMDEEYTKQITSLFERVYLLGREGNKTATLPKGVRTGLNLILDAGDLTVEQIKKIMSVYEMCYRAGVRRRDNEEDELELDDGLFRLEDRSHALVST